PYHATGLVVFVHGSGSSRLSPRNQSVAEILRATGLGTLLFDLLTKEEDAQDAITAELRFDVGFLAERLLAATHWARRQVPDLRVIPGASHLFEEPGTLDQVTRLAADWFQQHLRTAASAPAGLESSKSSHVHPPH